MKKTYLKHNPDPFAELREEVQKELEQMDEEQKERLEKLGEEFENPIGQ
jgi:hypothetical protein